VTGVAWLLILVVWFLAACLVIELHHRRRPRVTPLTRQESTDQLPISLALFAAWTHPGRNAPGELEAVRLEVRRLHPDLATALDRAVAASRTRAQEQAASAPTEVPQQREQFGQIRRGECAAGRHLWRGVPGMDLEECTRGGCAEIRTVA
jgi:hypothetical protein